MMHEIYTGLLTENVSGGKSSFIIHVVFDRLDTSIKGALDKYNIYIFILYSI